MIQQKNSDERLFSSTGLFMDWKLQTVKTKVDDLDAGKWKTVLIDLKKISDAVDKQVVKNAKFSTLKATVNNLEKKFLMRLL